MIDIEDIDNLLESQEKMVRFLRPGTEKKVLWAQGNGVKSKTSIVFIHGFSASRVEIDPVVDLIAAELNANVYFTRLRGHGQDGQALAEATYEQLLNDTTEAIEIGKFIGDILSPSQTQIGVKILNWLDNVYLRDTLVND